MQRRVVGLQRDEEGDWLADLDCLHTLQVGRTDTFGAHGPVRDRSAKDDEDGPAERTPVELECPLCDRAELPEGLVVVRTAGPFGDTDVPAGLRRPHRVGDGVWGRLRVLEGSVGFHMEGVVPTLERQVGTGENQPIPPSAPHELKLTGPVRLCVDFLRRQ